VKRMKQAKLSVWGLLLCLWLTAGPGSALGAEQPKGQSKEDWKFHAIVDVNFVMQYAVIPQPKNVMIVDSRPKQPKFENGSIPTAINIPTSKFDEMVGLLPKDKNTLLIFYCEGPT
jgi:hypothetical protein